MKKSLFFLGLFLIFVISDEPIQIQTTTGTLEGFIQSNTRYFLGIPYAEPPIGNLRFRSSTPKTPWKGVFNASAVGNACSQIIKGSSIPGMGEDCLTLNIYSPLNFDGKLPVLFWIYGGSFVSGWSGLYDGTKYAQKENVIVVTVNYRLGALGYFSSELLQKENPKFPTTGGMNGIYDQILALTWVKNNINNFGGDPEQITIFGESAGGLSVCMLLATPLSAKLFKNAIIESGSCLGPWAPATVDVGLASGAHFMQDLGAKTLDDLRAKTTEEILNSTYWGLFPTVDSFILPQHPYVFFLSNQLQLPKDGSLLLGSNSLDTLFVEPFYNGSLPQTVEEYQALLKYYFGENFAQVFQLYPPIPSPAVAAQKLNAHLCLTCPTKLISEILSPQYSVYLYEYSYNPVNGDYQNEAVHAAELGEVFGYAFPPFAFNEALSEKVMHYWATFAKSGVPSGDVEWPIYQKAYLELNTEITQKESFYGDLCKFWANYTPYQQTLEYCFMRKLSV